MNKDQVKKLIGFRVRIRPIAIRPNEISEGPPMDEDHGAPEGRDRLKLASRAGRWAIAILFVAAVAIKVGLLITSQSMADGDEAVEGLMAMHILRGLEHPIYQWGLRYGAGAGLEAHLAALLFSITGPSSQALKSVGLLFWCIDAALVYLAGRALMGPKVGLAAALLFVFSPAAAQWSLKVAGGHQIAVALCLLMILGIERKIHPAAIMPLAPLATFARPVALPFAALTAGYILLRGRNRLWSSISLFASGAISTVLLYPSLAKAQETWNPSMKSFQPLILLRSLAVAVTTFFSPNLNATSVPGGPILLVSLLWIAAFFAAIAWLLRQSRFGPSGFSSFVSGPGSRLLLYAASVFGVVFMVEPSLLAARHLILLQPIACLAIAAAGLSLSKRGRAALGFLMIAGCAVQFAEMQDPAIYGAGREEDGVERAQIQKILDELRANGIHYVYNAEPMLQWILMFESREQIIARAPDPNDRVPAYARRVDEARRLGQPVALLVRTGPRSFQLVLRPDPGLLDANFPPAPGAS